MPPNSTQKKCPQMASKGRLTAISVSKLKPGPKPIRVFDGGGLYIEVMPNGSRYWRMKYRHGGKEKRLALGVFPRVSIVEARKRHGEKRAILEGGRDPLLVQKADKLRKSFAAGDTFKAIGDDWLAIKAHDWTPLQLKKEKGRLERHAYPWIGALPVTEVGVPEVRPLLDRLVKAGHLEQAHRLREQMSRVFRHGVALQKCNSDPAHALADVLPARVYKRYATMTDPIKVAELLRAIDGFSGTMPVRCALQLAPLVFVRPGELRAAEWSEIEFDHRGGPRWCIAPARRKLKKAAKEHPDAQPHIVPLSTQAVAILNELKPLTGRSKFVFPGVRDRKRPMSENTINAALRRMGYDRDAMTGHGFRHMASTLLNELGHRKEAIERQLSHKEPGVAGVYNLAELLPERTTMMQAWADHLDALRSPVMKVVPFKRMA